MTQHTPTPWMQYGQHVITGDETGPIDALSEANAAYIVKACNMHEELAETCKVLVPLVARGLVEGTFDNIAAGRGYAERVMERTEALLAKANE